MSDDYEKLEWTEPQYWDIRTKIDTFNTRALEQTLTWQDIERQRDYLTALLEDHDARRA